MKNEVEFRQRQRIEKLRELMKPTPVRLHHEPRWLKKRITNVVGKSLPMWDAALAICGSASWLDHWGSIEKGSAFVAEPYLSVAMIEDAIEFSRCLGLQLRILATSEWYPGSTIRLEFREPKETLEEHRP